MHCWSPRPPSCASSSAACRRPGCSAPRPNSSQARSLARWPRPCSRLGSSPGAPRPCRPRSPPTTQLDRLTATTAPKLVALFGVGQDSAGALLTAAGDNPDRLRSDACFAMLCGASPIQASSGKTARHRLNRGGDRQANAALYRVVLVRLRWHQPTKDYMARRLKEGKSKKEIIRCLKRYVAREVFAALNQTSHDTLTPAA